MRRLLTLIYLPTAQILSLPYMLLVYLVGFFNRNLKRTGAYLFTRPYGIVILLLTGAQLEVTGTEHIDPKQNYLFVANHVSLLDSPLLMALVKGPLSFISKMEMKKVPIFSQWMVLLECLFLDRSNNREGLKVILKGIEQLKMGDNLAVFPQGTRSVGEEFLPFKAGSFKLATKSGKPVIPIAIHGTADVFENNNFNLKPSTVHVHIFPSIKTEGMTLEEVKALPLQVEAMIHNKVKAFKALEG